ncbi:MAG: DUF6305 family protein [bacterium]|nr:DUF6305 family protein [bacterium]
MMKSKWLYITLIFAIVFAAFCIASEFNAKQPILLTSAGQGPDLTMVKILAQKNNLSFTFDKLAKPDKLKGHATLLLVAGSSTKGLGAANIDKDQELARVQSLIKAAKEAKMPIVTLHVGGPSRRGKLSDDFNTIAAENADCLVIVKSGNDDGFFNKTAEAKKIPIFLIDKIVDAGNVLSQIFSEAK